MNILVTGGAGFIGSHIVDLLVQQGHQVFVVDNLSTGDPGNLNPNCTFYEADISKLPDLQHVFSLHPIDVVYHHAAQIHVQDSIKYPTFDAMTNIIGTINILECMKTYKASKIVYASSAAVYGTPHYLPINENHPVSPESCYGISKFTPEHYIKMYANLYEIDYTIFRYSNVYGPRQSSIGEGGVISIFLDKVLEQLTPTVYGDGTQTRDFIFVRDIAAANIAALHRGNGFTLNIGCNTTTSINELVDYLSQLSKRRIVPHYVAAKPGDILHSNLSNELAMAVLEWYPRYSLLEGLSETFDYLIERVAHPA